MMRMCDVDVLRCEHHGARRRLIATMTETFVVRRIRQQLGI